MPKIGADCGAYRNTGSYASPTFAELTCVGDWAVNPVWDKQEVALRASRAKASVKTLLGISISGKLLASDSGDAGYEAIRDAMNADTLIDFLILNGSNTTVGAWGYRFYGQVFQANESQNPGDVIMDDIVIEPSVPSDGNWPKYAEVTSGPAITYTAIGTAP